MTDDTGVVQLWDTVNGRLVRTLHGAARPELSGSTLPSPFSFSPDGTRLAYGDSNRLVHVWDIISGQEVLTLRGHTAAVTAVAFSPDSWRLASTDATGVVKIWGTVAAPEGNTLRLPAIPPKLPALVCGPAERLGFADGKAACLLDAVTSQTLLRLPITPGEGRVAGIAFSADGTHLAVAAKTIGVWDAATRQEVCRVPVRVKRFDWLALSPDGTRLATFDLEAEFKVWDATTGQLFWTLSTGMVPRGDSPAITFSPDGGRLAVVTNEDGVQVWDPLTGERLRAFPGRAALAFSPDTRLLATCCPDDTVKLWDLASGEEVLSLRGLTASALAFSPDARRLATGGADRRVLLWDLVTGQQLLAFPPRESEIVSLGFTSEGRRLICTDNSPAATVWDATSWTEETGVRREALELVAFLFGRSLPCADVLALLRDDATIRETVREQALALAKDFPESADPKFLDAGARAVARLPVASPMLYRLALHQAAAACQLAPDIKPYRTTLGMAQYRAGQFKAAHDSAQGGFERPHRGSLPGHGPPPLR